jgi:MoxR-like ATPase
MEIKVQIQKLLDELNQGIYEKKEVIALTILTAVAGESIFLLGAPGVAKSLIARRLKYAFKDGTSFEYLMNRFSTPDEIFGPVSILQLKDHGKYERIVKNYLPTATVVFLDEIWKAGPSIQNALLTVLNEKIYRNGDTEIKVPLKALISASNELPMQGEGLEALWDRFIIRYEVKPIEEIENFNKMILESSKLDELKINDHLQITHQKFEEWTAEINKITVPDTILNLVNELRKSIQENYNSKEDRYENKIVISDRRWKKIIKLLRTSAFLNDRKSVDLMDCFLMIHCIWHNIEQITPVSTLVKDVIQKHGYKLEINLRDLKEEIKDFDSEVKEETSFLKPILKDRLKPFSKDYYKISDYNNYFIRIVDYNSLKVKEATAVELHSKSGNSFYQETRRRCKKGNQKFSITISNSSYDDYNNSLHQLETEEYEEKIAATKRPHHATKKHWDKEVSKFLTITSNLKSQLEHYRKNDLQHLSQNLFVDASLVEIVVTNLNDTQKEIEKIEVKVREIQHYYENVEDQSKHEMKQLQDKSIE